MKNTPLCTAVVVWALCSVPVTRAQASSGSPQPASGHDRLAFFVGTWLAEADFKSSEPGSSQKSTWTETCQWSEGNYALICHTGGTFGGHPVKEISVEAYNAGEKTYVYFETNDTDDNDLWRGKLDGNTWTWEKKGMRFTQIQASVDSVHFKLESATSGGAFQLVMDGKKTRQK